MSKKGWGEEELWSQVIMRAYLDATLNYAENRKKKGRVKEAAIRWIFSDVVRPGSFTFAAQACTENPQAFIDSFRERVLNVGSAS